VTILSFNCKLVGVKHLTTYPSFHCTESLYRVFNQSTNQSIFIRQYNFTSKQKEKSGRLPEQEITQQNWPPYANQIHDGDMHALATSVNAFFHSVAADLSPLDNKDVGYHCHRIHCPVNSLLVYMTSSVS